MPRPAVVLPALLLACIAGCSNPPARPPVDAPDATAQHPPAGDAAQAAPDGAVAPDAATGPAPDAGAEGPDASAPGADAGACEGNEVFEIGAGMYDVTGPSAELGMMGYSQVAQKTAGIHTRLRSRAFVLGSPCNGERVVFVSADLGMVFQSVEREVLARLRTDFGDLYTERNVFLSATHTHSGPGGTSYYALYDLSVLGFNPQNFEAVVEGLHQSIVRAHANLAPGRILVAEGDLLEASINRSLGAYEKNPQAERDQHPYDLDKRMTVLRLETLAGEEIGLVDWFGVHATSMGNKNLLISGDNKGYASYRFEQAKGTDYAASRTFVAAFAQATAGDASPNIFGGENGGGADDFESTALSGEKQLARARELYDAAAEPLRGAVDSRHVFVKMDEVDVPAERSDGAAHVTCPAAMGVSAIAGAEDGPGFGVEGASCEVIAVVVDGLMCTPTQTACQAEKPIVMETGTRKPVPWTPSVLPFQVVRLGSLALVGSPFEVTTTAARRIRESVASRLAPLGVTRVIVVGPVNAYSSYVTTREEYAAQNYEGASTQFGPWQLVAVQQIYERLADAMQAGAAMQAGPTPPDLRADVKIVSLGVVQDSTPANTAFGAVVTDAQASYQPGQTVSVVFWGAHPANDLRLQDTYLRVERSAGTTWTTVARDWDWETKYRWKRVGCLPSLGCSQVTVDWEIPAATPAGTYRIRHLGNRKSLDGVVHPYEGVSREFEVR